MELTLESGALRVGVSTLGGELQSLKTPDGTEYLWQGDEKYWDGKAINLFPFIGRLTKNSYKLHGREYPMGIHGFWRNMEMEVAESGPDACLLRLRDTVETRAGYPFPFTLLLGYRLEGKRLGIAFTVQNTGDETMYFGIGGHPGFNVPLEAGLAFEDYALTFAVPCAPARVGFTEACYLSGEKAPYMLEGNQCIPLRHSLFDHDAIVLEGMDKTVTLGSAKGKKAVRVSYPDMPYVGFWHSVKSDAPFVCIEPWSSLPSRQDVVEAFSQKPDLIALPAGQSYHNNWSIECLG